MSGNALIFNYRHFYVEILNFEFFVKIKRRDGYIKLFWGGFPIIYQAIDFDLRDTLYKILRNI